MPRRPHHHVYVVELSRAVLQEPRFRKNNPGYVDGKPCVYVGMTGLNPDLRFDKHKAGIQANRFVQQYGLRLLPDLYEGFNPMSYAEAVEREVEIGIDLRSAGFGVWQAEEVGAPERPPGCYKPRFGPSARLTAAASAPLRAAMSSAWLSSMGPTLK